MDKKMEIDLSKLLDIKKPSSTSKAPLGRGIGALIKDMDITNNANLKQYIIKVDIEKCLPSPYQMRKVFNEDELKNLAQSISTYGVLQPILVKSYKDNYLIIAGERRVKASKIAGLKEVPAIELNVDDKTIMEVGVIENLQRQDLNPVEEANAFKALINEFKYTHEMVGKIIGKSRSYITNYLQILTLPTEVQSMLINGKISVSHARMLAGMENPEEFANKIATEGLSVTNAYSEKQQNNNIITKQKKQKNLKSYITNPQLLYWVDSSNIDSKLCSVNIKSTNENEGKIVISYKSMAELSKLLKIQS